MKILYISNVVPDPAGSGSPRRAAFHLWVLQQIGQVTLVVPPLEGACLDDLKDVTVLERGHSLALSREWRHGGSRSPLKRFIHALRRMNLVDGRASRDEAKLFRAMLADDFDLVFAFRLSSALWYESVFGRSAKAVRIADLDDIESRVFAKRVRDTTEPWWYRPKMRHELRWLLRTERRVAEQWDVVCLCSQLDADRFLVATGVAPWIVPNTYRFDATAPEPSSPPCRMLFVGTFGYFANVEGISWFVETIWPKVRAALGDSAELILVGLTPPPAIQALGELQGITVAGNVPSVEPYYAAANIVIAPLLSGSGTRIKLIEAAAKRRAIVCTTLGCEGLGFIDGVHAEIADDPADFAARIVRLAGDPRRREEMAEACRDFAQMQFSVKKVLGSLSERIESLVSRR